MVSYPRTRSFIGDARFTYTAEAEDGSRDDGTVSVTVFPVNAEADAPKVEPGDGFAKNDSAKVVAWRSTLIKVDGIVEVGKVILLFLAALWIMTIAVRAGVSGVRISKIHAAYSLGASKWQILRHMIMPNSLPEIFTGARVAMGHGDSFVSTNQLGDRINDGQAGVTGVSLLRLLPR